MPRTLLITHGDVILEHEILEHGAVLVEDGRIVGVFAAENAPKTSVPTVVDAGGSYIAPGLIDTHNDGLEAEINPRPYVNFPAQFALANFERRVVSAGVTTSFHAVMFANYPGKERSLEDAIARTEMIAAAGRGRAVEHEVLHRLDLWSPGGLDAAFRSIEARRVRALSLNDHTPGQGQFRDLDAMKRTFAAIRGEDADQVERELLARMAERAQEGEAPTAVTARVREEKTRLDSLIVASHDDDTVDKVDAMIEAGATVAEFPVTLEAARRARDHGMWITIGAPNVVRGGSASGNIAAMELVAAGLADVICADYHAPSMLAAAAQLTQRGLTDLPAAIAMLTAKPARAFGLEDRGRIEPGLRADLCLFHLRDDAPVVTHVIRDGEVVFSAPALEPAAAPTRVGS